MRSLRLSRRRRPRPRHRGVSHHSLTAYGRVALRPGGRGGARRRTRGLAGPPAVARRGTGWSRWTTAGCSTRCAGCRAAVDDGPRAGRGAGRIPGGRRGRPARGAAALTAARGLCAGLAVAARCPAAGAPGPVPEPPRPLACGPGEPGPLLVTVRAGPVLVPAAPSSCRAGAPGLCPCTGVGPRCWRAAAVAGGRAGCCPAGGPCTFSPRGASAGLAPDSDRAAIARGARATGGPVPRRCGRHLPVTLRPFYAMTIFGAPAAPGTVNPCRARVSRTGRATDAAGARYCASG